VFNHFSYLRWIDWRLEVVEEGPVVDDLVVDGDLEGVVRTNCQSGRKIILSHAVSRKMTPPKKKII
jgi:hypothetical protein